MNKHSQRMAIMLLTGFLITSAFADTVNQQYQQKTLPDGSIEMDYSSSDGTKVVSIKHPDGSTVTTATDANGNQTITTTSPNGDVNVQTKKAG